VRCLLSPISGGIAIAALLATACNGDLHPFGAGPGTDGGHIDAPIVTDTPVKKDTSVTPDAFSGVCPDNPPVGFATMSDLGGEWDGGTAGMPNLQVSGGVTGGGSGMQVTVDASDADALAEFSMYASDKMPGPLTILIDGMIAIPPPPDGGSGDVQKIRVSSNKTVAGVGDASGFTGGGITLTSVNNVILRNLVIDRPNSDDAGDNVDAIHIETSHQIWVDHCDLSSNGPTATPAYDGLVDISDGSDFVTVSWTRYHDHGDTGLVGRSDSSAAAAQDASKNHVTYDHDWFNNVLTGPRVRFGTIHVLNAFFEDVANYGVASIDGANTLIENSVFQNVAPPPQDDSDFGWVTTMLSSASAGSVDLVNNQTDASDGTAVLTAQAMISLPYAYSADPRDAVVGLVENCAGTGIVTPLPPSKN
jgi:pectate lyase